MLRKINAAMTAVANLMTICFNGGLGCGDRTFGDIGQKEEGRRKKEEGRRKKEEGRKPFDFAQEPGGRKKEEGVIAEDLVL
jgi:hypothetical protein